MLGQTYVVIANALGPHNLFENIVVNVLIRPSPLRRVAKGVPQTKAQFRIALSHTTLLFANKIGAGLCRGRSWVVNESGGSLRGLPRQFCADVRQYPSQILPGYVGQPRPLSFLVSRRFRLW